MIIEITEKQTSHCWAVHMDALQVSFNSLEDAKVFVGQLKARIDAPHVWPVAARAMPGRRSALAAGQNTRADVVK